VDNAAGEERPMTAVKTKAIL